MEAFRKTLVVLLGAFAVWMGYAVLTVPVISATAPAVLLIASIAAAYFLWPKSHS